LLKSEGIMRTDIDRIEKKLSRFDLAVTTAVTRELKLGLAALKVGLTPDEYRKVVTILAAFDNTANATEV
jgi:hypothetical protein